MHVTKSNLQMPFEHYPSCKAYICGSFLQCVAFHRLQLYQQPSGEHLCGLNSHKLHQFSHTGIVGKRGQHSSILGLHMSVPSQTCVET